MVHEAIAEFQKLMHDSAKVRAIRSDAARKLVSMQVLALVKDCEARRESSVTAAALGCWYCAAGNVPVSWSPWGQLLTTLDFWH